MSPVDISATGPFPLEIIFKANATTITIIRIVAVHVISVAIQN